MNTDWSTEAAHLAFIHDLNTLTDKGDMLHDFYLTGADYGAILDGYTDNFAWGTLSLDGKNGLRLYDGDDDLGGALYLAEILGLDVCRDLISNIYGIDGLNIYYLAWLPGNSYLRGLNYGLIGGGQLIAIGDYSHAPEPATILLLGTGLLGLIGFRRKFRI